MKRVLTAITAGITLTILLTFIGLAQGSRARLCVFVWQACMVQLVVHTPDNPIHEASPIDFFGFVIGVLLGVPIYSLIVYGALTLSARRPNDKSRE